MEYLVANGQEINLVMGNHKGENKQQNLTDLESGSGVSKEAAVNAVGRHNSSPLNWEQPSSPPIYISDGREEKGQNHLNFTWDSDLTIDMIVLVLQTLSCSLQNLKLA